MHIFENNLITSNPESIRPQRDLKSVQCFLCFGKLAPQHPLPSISYRCMFLLQVYNRFMTSQLAAADCRSDGFTVF
uniref:Uncharacterized protein n=1 Tax=Anguilla anguilla TaxID=7936 RepID=A0A0E9WQ57_ANGAN